MDLSDENQGDYSRRRRALIGPTGCGLCGIESLTELAKPPPEVNGTLRLSSSMIKKAMESRFLPAPENINRETQAMHAAGFWAPKSGLIAVREDVGRHNALDKLVGALARKSVDGRSGMVAITSRVSVEMVQKPLGWGRLYSSRFQLPPLSQFASPMLVALH